MNDTIFLIELLETINNNIDNIYLEKSINMIVDIKKINKEKVKSFIFNSINFLKMEQEFYLYSNMNNNDLMKNIDKYKELGKKLNILKEQLKNQFNELYKVIKLENKKSITKYLESNNMSSDFVNENIPVENKNINNPKDMIAFFINEYRDDLLYSSYVKKEMNNKLNYNLFTDVINELVFESFLDACCHESIKGIDEYNIYMRTEVEKLKILFKKIDIISKFYNNCSIENVRRLGYINNFLIDIYNNNMELKPSDPYYAIKMNYSKEVDLFELLFRYDELSKNNILSEQITKEDKTLNEIFDYMFDKLDDYEIAYFLYDFYVVFRCENKLISNNKDFIYKDLDNLIDMISRRKKDGIKFELLVDNIAKGKININLEDKESINNFSQIQKKL